MKIVLCVLLMMAMIWGTDMFCKGENMNIILDPSFLNGGIVYSPSKPMRMSGKITLSDHSVEWPQWLVTQWNSRNNLVRTKLRKIDGSYIYQNEFKTVARDADGTLTLRVNGGEEYERARTSLLDGWVHLYFEQRYQVPYPLQGADMARLNLSFAIPYFEDYTPKGELNLNLHAVISVFYIILKDVNPDSPSYEQYINFCVMLFDNRTGVTKEESHMDSGQNPIDATNMLVYTMNSEVYADPVYADGAWHDVDVDLMPYFRRALQLAQQKNCMMGTRFEDLAISSIFFGFEVPGVMNCEMKLRNPSLVLGKEE